MEILVNKEEGRETTVFNEEDEFQLVCDFCNDSVASADGTATCDGAIHHDYCCCTKCRKDMENRGDKMEATFEKGNSLPKAIKSYYMGKGYLPTPK